MSKFDDFVLYEPETDKIWIFGRKNYRLAELENA